MAMGVARLKELVPALHGRFVQPNFLKEGDPFVDRHVIFHRIDISFNGLDVMSRP